MSWDGAWLRGDICEVGPVSPCAVSTNPPIPLSAQGSLSEPHWPELATPGQTHCATTPGLRQNHSAPIPQPPAPKRPVAGPAGAGCPFSARLFLPACPFGDLSWGWSSIPGEGTVEFSLADSPYIHILSRVAEATEAIP